MNPDSARPLARTTTITFDTSTEKRKDDTTLYIPSPRDRERGKTLNPLCATYLLTHQGHPIVEETGRARIDVDSDDGKAVQLGCSALWLMVSFVEGINGNNGIVLTQEQQQKLTNPKMTASSQCPVQPPVTGARLCASAVDSVTATASR